MLLKIKLMLSPTSGSADWRVKFGMLTPYVDCIRDRYRHVDLSAILERSMCCYIVLRCHNFAQPLDIKTAEIKIPKEIG